MLSKVISQANIDHVEKWFERAEKIVIVTHVSPDGDAIGSSLGLWHFLEFYVGCPGRKISSVTTNIKSLPIS